MLVPEAYGFKSVKWLQRVVLTNAPAANDTYANGNNDIDSWMKTFARFAAGSYKAAAGQPLALTGLAQVGISGLSKVQYWVHREEGPLPADDPYFTTAPWKDAEILPAPERWGGGLPGEQLPAETRHFDAATGRPQAWPLRYSLAHWAVLLEGLPAGKYDLRCRSIDANGIAQPLPRPFAKSGRNSIQHVPLEIG
jgi:hypothetical protein